MFMLDRLLHDHYVLNTLRNILCFEQTEQSSV